MYYKITMDNPDGTYETVWEGDCTLEEMDAKFLSVIYQQQEERRQKNITAWRVIRAFDAQGKQIRQES